MRKTALTGAAILALSLMLSACSAGGTDTTTTEPAAPEASQSATEAVTRAGDFEGSGDKSVAGSVAVSDSEIVLSGYSSDEGPDLHVYLTNGTEEADVASGMQIETVAFDEASQTFTLDGVNVADYDTVVIYCDKVKAVFGSASLS